MTATNNTLAEALEQLEAVANDKPFPSIAHIGHSAAKAILATLRASTDAAAVGDDWDRGADAIIKEAAKLIAPGAGEAVFYIRVGGTQTSLNVKTNGDVDPDTALQNAIAVLNGERGDLSNCPMHNPPADAAADDYIRIENAECKGMDKGADFCIKALAETLGVDDWEQADGSETWHGDVAGTICNVLKAGRVYDEEDGRVARLEDAHPPVADAAVAGEAVHRAVKMAHDTMAMSDDGSDGNLHRAHVHAAWVIKLAALSHPAPAEPVGLREAITQVMVRCEALEDEAHEGLARENNEHATGFYRGQKSVAKSIRRELHDLTLPSLLTELEALRASWGRMVEALEWYGEQARLCRLIHREGDAGRHALADDGGKRARAALQPAEDCGEVIGS